MMTRLHGRTLCVSLVIMAIICSIVLVETGNFAMAGGKKKFLKGFILGTLLAKNSYPIVYQMPAHGASGGHHGGYGAGGW